MNQIILQIILIALNAVFAATEIAVISLNAQKLEKMAESGDKRAKKLVKISLYYSSSDNSFGLSRKCLCGG